MGFNKEKALRAAEKYVAQEKFTAAIEEYRKIVANEANDFSALNMLGDLYVRTDNKSKAITCFMRVAEHYREEGFALKAIAMYKKIDRLTPGVPEIAAKLAALYAQLGLVAEARTQYLVVANSHTRAGQTQKALEILRKIADLDPHNVEVRIKLAESYLREGFQREAGEAFVDAGAQLVARGAYERALWAYLQALELNPQDRAALSGAVTAHGALGTASEAAQMVERALAEQPEDEELLSLVARAYVDAQNAPAAERAIERLVEREPTSYARFVDVARLYLKEGHVDTAVRVLTRIAEPMLAGREDDVLLDLLNEALAHDPDQLYALRMLVRIHTWQRDDEKLRAALERLAEAARASGHADEERSALTQLTRLAPDQPRYRERLAALGGELEKLAEQEISSAPEPAQEEEIPTFESFMLNYDEPVGTQAEEITDFEWNPAAQPANPSASFADLNDDFAAPAAASVEETVKSEHPSEFQEIDFSLVMGAPQTGVEAAESTEAPGIPDPRREGMLRHELESVDFYLEQGYLDIAGDTLDMLERQFGQHEEIMARRERLVALGGAPAVEMTTAVEGVAFDAFAAAEVAARGETLAPVEEAAPVEPRGATPPAGPQDLGLDPGLAAVFDEFRTAIEEDVPPSDADYETHYNLGLAYQEMELIDEAVEEFQKAVALVTPQDGTLRYMQCCHWLGHCFMKKGMPRLAIMWFKKALETPGLSVEEQQALRYELGLAYEHMGELDQAIDVFMEIYGIDVSYRGVAEKLRELQAQQASR
jgi:tetratricopeptide (TPR) repeat protein